MGKSTAGPINLAVPFNPALNRSVPAHNPVHRLSWSKLKAQCLKLSKSSSCPLFLAELGFDRTSYDVLLLDPNDNTLAACLPTAQPFNLEEQGPQVDPQEWLAPSVLRVGQKARWNDNGRASEFIYADYAKEYCRVLPNGQKDGPYRRCSIWPEQRYFCDDSDRFGGDHFEEGSYFHGIPCGKFKVQDDNEQIQCAGRYELMEVGPDEVGQTINIIELNQRLFYDYSLDHIFLEERSAWEQGEKTPTINKTVHTNTIVARYGTLSRMLPNGMRQIFSVGPELPAVMITRQDDETWYEACRRTHQAVLALVQEQVEALHEAQRSSYNALNADAPAHLQLLGQAQPSPLIRGANRGGFWGIILQTLPQAQDGTYLSGILVSSESFLKTICAPDYQVPVAHYSMQKNNRFVQAHETDERALPIWASWAQLPVLSLESFCWRAQGKSEIKDPTGEDEATITYGNQGLAEGAFDLYNKAPATAEHGTFKQGLLDPSFSFELYQDYRSRFPAASFTLDARTGRPKGPFTLNFTIDELFDQGYHAALLETYDVKTEYGTKTQKRLCDYSPGTYVKKEGTYERGRPKLSKRCKLKPCPNTWFQQIWDADVEVVRFGGRGQLKDKNLRDLFKFLDPPKKKRRYNRWWR